MLLIKTKEFPNGNSFVLYSIYQVITILLLKYETTLVW